MSGIGKFVWQNGDHSYRNTIFRLLVEKSWPVTSVFDNTEYKFTYYLGFWLPSALLGKAFGLKAGFLFQYLWAFIGICSLFFLLCAMRKRISLKMLVLIIFFSGLDYIGTTLPREYLLNPISASHIEWWANYFQYSSMTTQLFWVFNQALPAWLAVTLLLYQKNNKNVVFIMGVLFLNATFPFIGLLPIAAYLYCRNIKTACEDEIRERVPLQRLARPVLKQIGESLTFQNIIGGGVSGIITFLYFSANVRSSSIQLSYSPDKKYWIYYALFFVLEVGIYLALIFTSQKKNPLYYICGFCLLTFPLFYIPDGNFIMRASIPALFILMLYVIDELETCINQKRRALLLFVLLVGGITPCSEIIRTIKQTYNRVEVIDKTKEFIMKDDPNFRGNPDAFFFRKLAARQSGRS